MKVKFLIIRLSSIGDIVLTSPVIRCLKQQVEGAEIHFLTKPQFGEILENNPYIDKVHILQKVFRNSLKDLKEERFDYIIDLHNNLRSHRVKKALGILSFSFNKLNLKKWLLVNFKIDKLPKIHIVDRYLETTKLFDLVNDNKGLDFFIPEKDFIDIKKLYPQSEDKFICLVVGAKHFTKQIPISKAVEICNNINTQIIILGGKEEKEKADEIIQISENKKLINLCGITNLNQSAYIIKNSELVISSDTGLMHIAAAFNKKIISVWGNTVPEFGMYPYVDEKNNFIVQVNSLKCRPCSKIGFKICPKKHFKCMNDIDVKEISKIVNKEFTIEK